MMLAPNGPEQLQTIPILIGAPVACADDEALVEPVVVALLPAALVVLLVVWLLLDEHAATSRTVAKAHAPYESFFRLINYFPPF
jgi:hypothetical protein